MPSKRAQQMMRAGQAYGRRRFRPPARFIPGIDKSKFLQVLRLMSQRRQVRNPFLMKKRYGQYAFRRSGYYKGLQSKYVGKYGYQHSLNSYRRYMGL